MMLSALSKRYLRVPMSATQAGVPIDLTTLTVEFAFTDDPDVNPVTWNAGEWESYTNPTFPHNVIYLARVLVGPSTTVGALTVGTHYVHVRIPNPPEELIFRIPERLQVFGEVTP
jgi:hypothetical protein